MSLNAPKINEKIIKALSNLSNVTQRDVSALIFLCIYSTIHFFYIPISFKRIYHTLFSLCKSIVELIQRYITTEIHICGTFYELFKPNTYS